MYKGRKVVSVFCGCWWNDKDLTFLTFIIAKLKDLYVVLDEFGKKNVKE